MSLILLRSVLHHIADVDGFLRSCAAVLPAGGLLVCEAPYYDGYIVMGLLGQFIEDALAVTGYTCTPKEQQDLKHFVNTMQFYGRRDVDKSKDEDKHPFRPDELMVTGREMGLELSHYPNWRMTLSPEENVRNRIGYFQQVFSDHIRFCMGWTSEFSDRVAAAMRKYFRFFEPLETAGNTTPSCFGTFVFTKRKIPRGQSPGCYGVSRSKWLAGISYKPRAKGRYIRHTCIPTQALRTQKKRLSLSRNVLNRVSSLHPNAVGGLLLRQAASR